MADEAPVVRCRLVPDSVSQVASDFRFGDIVETGLLATLPSIDQRSSVSVWCGNTPPQSRAEKLFHARVGGVLQQHLYEPPRGLTSESCCAVSVFYTPTTH